MAYDQLEPFGPKAVNLNAGLIVSAYANCHRKKGSKPIRPDKMAIGDFGYGGNENTGGSSRAVKKQTVEEQKQMIFAIAGAFGTKKTKEKLR